MGFGWLFIGYFLTVMNIPVLGIFGTVIRIVGCALTVYGLLSLRNYNKAFNFSIVGAALMSVMSILLLCLNIDDILFSTMIIEKNIFSESVKTAIGYAEQGVWFVYYSLLLWGIGAIAKETEDKKVLVGAVRNYIFICIYYVLYLVSFLPFKHIQAMGNDFARILWVLYLVNIVLGLLLLFNCYARICDEDDVEMNKKKTRIPIITALQEETERRSKKAREADALYRMERRAHKEEKKREKKKRGKK